MLARAPGMVSGMTQQEPDPQERHLAERADLLPEERAAGSSDPLAQAAAVLEESQDRTEHPDPDASTQSGRRRSEDTA
jgi:hypothetical protein